MKLENFTRVQEIVTQINKHREKIEDLMKSEVWIIFQSSNYNIMSIGTWSSCDHECQPIAAKFLSDVKEYYANKIKSLHTELEQL